MSGIYLSAPTFSGLSVMARAEILAALGAPSAPVSQASPVSVGLPVEEDIGMNDVAADFTPAQIKNFMAGVGDKTKRLLQLVAEQNGRATMGAMLKITGDNDWHKLAGFFAGVTKRSRTIMHDKDVFLLSFDWRTAKYEGDELIDGEYFVSNLTRESLRRYFGLD